MVYPFLTSLSFYKIACKGYVYGVLIDIVMAL